MFPILSSVSSLGFEDDPLAPGLEILQRGPARLGAVVAKLKALEKANRLTIPLTEIVPSYIHMFVNRLVRSAQRAHELVLCDFLEVESEIGLTSLLALQITIDDLSESRWITKSSMEERTDLIAAKDRVNDDG